MAAISGSHSGSQKTRQIAAATLFFLMHFDEIHLVKVRGSNEKWKLVTEAGIGRTGNFEHYDKFHPKTIGKIFMAEFFFDLIVVWKYKRL